MPISWGKDHIYILLRAPLVLDNRYFFLQSYSLVFKCYFLFEIYMVKILLTTKREFVGHEKITGRSPLWFSILPLMVVADRDQEILSFLL